MTCVTWPRWSLFLIMSITAAAFLSTADTSLGATAYLPDISTSLNPVGSGARATGMGGAFIAIADDATAASWNPSGLLNLEKPEASIVYSYFNRGQTNRTSDLAFDIRSQGNTMDSHDLNFFSLAYPFNLFNRNMIVTLNYQQQYNMVKSQTLNLSQTVQVTDNVGVPTGQSIHYPWISSYEQRGFLSTISPAIAFQVLPELYFGVTVNFWDDLLGACNWKNSSISTVNLNGNTSYYQQNSNYKFSGRNINLGMMYSLKQKFNFGLVYKTAFNADLDTTTTVLQTGEPPATTSEKQTMSMPASYGVGFAYRHSDNLSLSFDIYRTDWSEYSVTTARGVKNPLSGKYIVAFDPSLTSSDMGGKPHDTTQVRIGGEYLVIDEKMTIPIRVGVYYDPEPGQAKVDNLFGVSLGSGVAIRDIALDISYQYRWGNRVSGDVQNSTFNSDISQHTIMTSLIYHF